MPPSSPRHLPACLPSPALARRLETPLWCHPDPVDTSHAPCLSPSPLLTMADAAALVPT